MDNLKLPHISDLPNNLHYLPKELKHLIPIHHTTLHQNIQTILHNESIYHPLPIFQDQNLTKFEDSNYEVVSGGWCQDVDGFENQFKRSLELCTVMINYVHCVVGNIREGGGGERRSNYGQEDDEEDGKSKGNVVIRKQCFFEEDDLRPQPIEFPFNEYLAYNIYKYTTGASSCYIFLVGHNPSPNPSYVSLLNTVRTQNIIRHKIPTIISFEIERYHKILQNLLTTAKGFIDIPHQDLNLKKDLQRILEGQRNDGKVIKEEALRKSVRKNVVDKNVRVLLVKYAVSYRDKFDQACMHAIAAEIMPQFMQLLPMNTQSSFAITTTHNPKLNQILIHFCLSYKKTFLKSLSFPKITTIQKSTPQIIHYLQTQTQSTLKAVPHNIADEMFKSSISIFNKYQQGNLKSMDQKQEDKSMVSKRNSGILDDSFFSGFDKRSMISMKSSRTNQSKRYRKSVVQSRIISPEGENVQSQQMNAYRNNEYSQILNLLAAQAPIPTPQQLETHLKSHITKAHLAYSSTQPTSQQSQILKSIANLTYFLTEHQVSQLLIQHQQYAQCIMETLMQPSRTQFWLDVGKIIAKECIQEAYRGYICEQGFKVQRYGLFVRFAKKWLSLYGLKSLQLDPNSTSKISIPILLEILQQKQYRTEPFNMLVLTLLPTIFPPTLHLKLLSPLLQQCHTKLSINHHKELINSVIADLAYEIIYHMEQIYNQNLSNKVYTHDGGQDQIKVKKVREILREGGFNMVGCQLQNLLIRDIVGNYQSYTIPEAIVYYQVKVNKVFYLRDFVHLLSISPYTQIYSELNLFYQRHQQIISQLPNTIAALFLKQQVREFKFDSDQAFENQDTLTLDNRKSQSGIFSHLLSYNPQLKLAGQSLSKLLTTPSTQTPNLYDYSHIVQKLNLNLTQIYDYIQIALNMKDKYHNYGNLNKQDRIYFREIVHQILGKKRDIYLYVDFGEIWGVGVDYLT